MNKLGFGLMRLPVIDGVLENVDMATVNRMVDSFITAGGTYFDTAYMYHGGKSEEVLREAVVKRYPRESFLVADKLPVFMMDENSQPLSIFEEQLERCGVDYFDYYLLHGMGSEGYETSKKINAFDFVAQKKAEGKIRRVGFSFHGSPELLDKILKEHPEFEFVQLQINYLDWDDAAIRSRECYDIAVSHGKPVIVMEPVKGGSLAEIPKAAEELLKELSPELSIASWAVRFAASLENVTTVLSGMSNMEQMQDNLSYMSSFAPLSSKENEAVMKAADIIRSTIAIACTECRYCADGCPKNIPIPDIFAIYNHLKRFGKNQQSETVTRYKDLCRDCGKASDCIQCGKCEELCPQHLTIREHLGAVASELE